MPDEAVNVSRLPAAPDGNGVVPVSVMVVDPGKMMDFVEPPGQSRRVKVPAPVSVTVPLPPVVMLRMPNVLPPVATVLPVAETSVMAIVPVVAVTVRLELVRLKTLPVPVHVSVPDPNVIVAADVPPKVADVTVRLKSFCEKVPFR